VRSERCWPLAVGVFRWTGTPPVGVSVGRNCRAVVVWCSADVRAWPVECPRRSAVRCGSCQPPPDGQTEATSPDRGHRGMMPGDWFGSLLLQGFTPMLIAPAAGVGGVHPDHGDAAAGGDADQPGPKPRGGDTRYGAAQPLSAFPAAEGFPAVAAASRSLAPSSRATGLATAECRTEWSGCASRD
jgi:hypothetical protein